jgi:annexin A7/11
MEQPFNSVSSSLPIFLSRPPSHLLVLDQMWQEAQFGTTLGQVVSRRLGSDPELRDVLLYAIEGSSNRGGGFGIWRDVERIEDALATKNDFLLLMRLVRAHWDQPRFAAIVKAYATYSKKPLMDRVEAATMNDFCHVLKEIVKQPRHF